ncbi:MAG: hypothetical protein ABJN36_20840 [Cyclobacteriaceae bacterium]
MKTLLKIISFIGLCLTIVPPFLVFYGVIEKPTHFTLMGIGALLWFATAPFWMKNPSLEEAED